jgi:acyl carrier protein
MNPMTDAQIVVMIQEALASVAPTRVADFQGLTLDATIESLGLDSIATMEMVGAIEDRISTTFPDEDLAKVQKISDLARLIRAASA